MHRNSISESQKAQIVKYREDHPKCTYKEALAWAKKEFYLEDVPAESSVVKWFKPDTKKR